MMLAYAALILASFIWGANSPIMKWALSSLPLFTLAFLRFYLATILLLPFAIKSAKIERADWPKIILASFLGITLNVAFFFIGLKLTFAVNAALIIATIPIFAIFGAHLFLKEKIASRLIFSATVAIIGLLIIIGPPILTLGMNHFFGAFFLILASLTWVGYEIVSKDLFKKYSPQTVTFYSFLIGSLSFLPFFLWELFSTNWIFELQLPGIIGIAYGAIFSSTVAYLSWQWGLSKLRASEATFFFYLEPISGVLASIAFLNEKVSPFFVVGATLIAASVFMAEFHRKLHPIHKRVAKIT